MVLGAGREKSQLQLVPLADAPKVGQVEFAPVFARRERLAGELEQSCGIGRVVVLGRRRAPSRRARSPWLRSRAARSRRPLTPQADQGRSAPTAGRSLSRVAPSWRSAFNSSNAARSGSSCRWVTSTECRVTTGSQRSSTACHRAHSIAVLGIANDAEQRGHGLGMPDADHLAALLGNGGDHALVSAHGPSLLAERLSFGVGLSPPGCAGRACNGTVLRVGYQVPDKIAPALIRQSPHCRAKLTRFRFPRSWNPNCIAMGFGTTHRTDW